MNERIVTKAELMDGIYPYFESDRDMCLLVCDMGFAVTDRYFAEHPDRTFNMGIAEQATISMAAGLAMTGHKPLVYSQIPFITMRPFEQIRYDLNEHNLNVILIGVGAESYFSTLGKSHCFEKDVELMSLLDNIKIFSPTTLTLKDDLAEAMRFDGPVYIRCR